MKLNDISLCFNYLKINSGLNNWNEKGQTQFGKHHDQIRLKDNWAKSHEFSWKNQNKKDEVIEREEWDLWILEWYIMEWELMPKLLISDPLDHINIGASIPFYDLIPGPTPTTQC